MTLHCWQEGTISYRRMNRYRTRTTMEISRMMAEAISVIDIRRILRRILQELIRMAIHNKKRNR